MPASYNIRSYCPARGCSYTGGSAVAAAIDAVAAFSVSMRLNDEGLSAFACPSCGARLAFYPLLMDETQAES
jgi:hypothetical protein